MKKSNILLVIVMVALQGFFSCKSDDISPHSFSQKSSERILNLIKTNHWKVVAKPTDKSKIIFLNDIQKATQFFEKIKKDTFPSFGDSKLSLLKSDMVLARGVFTFLNSEKAKINFETSVDGKGEIIDIDLDGSKVTFIQKGSYIEIYKWGIVALPINQEEFVELGEFQYYYVPTAIYKAFLVDNSWSSVQFLYAPEQANFEGDGGTWEPFYLNRNPFILPTIEPWIPKHH